MVNMNIQKIDPLVSIIIPIYNAQEYLDKCLQSLQKQTLTQIEIILVDDGSTDKSINICYKYANIDSRFKIIHLQNSGAAQARKIGVINSCGKYIGFVDADDWVECNMYEILYNYAIRYLADIVICKFFDDVYINTKRALKYNHFLKSGLYDKESIQKNIESNLLYSNKYNRSILPPGLWDKLFRRELLIKNIKYIKTDILIGEDQLWSLPCIIDANSIYVSDKYLYHYRNVEFSITKRYKKNYFNNIIKYIMALKEILIEKNRKNLLNQLDLIMATRIVNAIINELKNDEVNFSNKKSIILYYRKNKIISKCFDDINYKIHSNIKEKLIWNLVKYQKIYCLLFLYIIHKKAKNVIKKLNLYKR